MIHQCIGGATSPGTAPNNPRVYRRLPPDPRDIIKHLRDARGFPSDRALATAAGIQQPTLSRYLAGTTETMEMQNWIALSHTLGVTVSELLGEVPLNSSGTVRDIFDIVSRLDQRGQETIITVGRALLGVDKPPKP
jgi:transcriptional regulator with XRE-family HTH domain